MGQFRRAPGRLYGHDNRRSHITIPNSAGGMTDALKQLIKRTINEWETDFAIFEGAKDDGTAREAFEKNLEVSISKLIKTAYQKGREDRFAMDGKGNVTMDGKTTGQFKFVGNAIPLGDGCYVVVAPGIAPSIVDFVTGERTEIKKILNR